MHDVVTEWGSPYQDQVCTKIVGYLSVKDQSVTGLVTSSPVSQSPGRRSLGSSPTTRSVPSATATQASSAPTTSRRVLALPRMATIIPAAAWLDLSELDRYCAGGSIFGGRGEALGARGSCSSSRSSWCRARRWRHGARTP